MEERFDTCQEKDLDLHKKFIRPARKRKLRKEADELEEHMGISKEAIQGKITKHSEGGRHGEAQED